MKIQISNLDLFYGNFQALKNINIEIPEKRVTAFGLRQEHSAQDLKQNERFSGGLPHNRQSDIGRRGHI